MTITGEMAKVERVLYDRLHALAKIAYQTLDDWYESEELCCMESGDVSGCFHDREETYLARKVEIATLSGWGHDEV